MTAFYSLTSPFKCFADAYGERQVRCLSLEIMRPAKGTDPGNDRVPRRQRLKGVSCTRSPDKRIKNSSVSQVLQNAAVLAQPFTA